MGIKFNTNEKANYISSYKAIKSVDYNTKVALWQIPYEQNLTKFDTDESKWFETINEFGDNEIEQAEKNLKISYSRYKVHTKTTTYSDNTKDIISKYPNGIKTIEHHGKNHVFVDIKDKFGRVVAEKIFNYESNDGRKTIYKHIKQGENVLTVVRIFSYDTNKNRKTDIVNFGYTGEISALSNGCELEREYCLLNGQEVKAEQNENFEYTVIDKNGNKLVFTED